MNHKDKLKELALSVNEGLNIYIAVHNVIFRDSATIMSFLKNLFGKGVPMAKLLEYAENLIPLWCTISDKMVTFKSSTYVFLSDDEKSYFDILNNYVNALRITVDCLVERQKHMDKGSKGIRDKAAPFLRMTIAFLMLINYVYLKVLNKRKAKLFNLCCGSIQFIGFLLAFGSFYFITTVQIRS